MERRPFSEVLKNAEVDIRREYDRLYMMFYGADSEEDMSYYEYCAQNFHSLPFRGTCISLKDFDEVHSFHFEPQPADFDLNYLVNFCEYLYNIVIFNQRPDFVFQSVYGEFPNIMMQIRGVIEKIGYMEARSDMITIFVPKSQPAIVVSEMLPKDLSYKVIEYNHHSMKGDLKRKQATLKLLADQLEAKRKQLSGLNKSLMDDLFYLFNKMNIRHNNTDPTSSAYKKEVAEMPTEELEEWYDRTYDMCLYAFMTLDQADRNAKMKELKAKLGDV